MDGTALLVFEASGRQGVLNTLIYRAPPFAHITVAGACMVDDVIRPVVAVNKNITIDFVTGPGPGETTYAAFSTTFGYLTDARFDPAEIVTGYTGLVGAPGVFELLRPRDPHRIEHVKVLIRHDLDGAPIRAPMPTMPPADGRGRPAVPSGPNVRTARKPSERRSPPTERVIAVINLLTAHPDKRFTLTDIIRQLDITKATCHALLQSLTRAGFVVRHSDKTYTLGPAMVAAGRVAQKSFSALAAARPEMETLAAEFDAVVSAAAVVGDELVIVERVGPDSGSDQLQVGHAMPFSPPLGMPFVAWGDAGEFDRWLARSRHHHSPEEQQRWQQVAAGVRELGYGVERMTESWRQVRALVGELADDQLSPQVRDLLSGLVAEIGPDHYLPEDIRVADRLPVSVIYAPVLDEWDERR